MSNVANCTLNLVGPVLEESYLSIKAALERHGGLLEEDDPGCFSFDDVPYGAFLHEHLLAKHGVSWIWRKGMDDHEGCVITCHDAEDDSHLTCPTIDGKIAITIDQIDDPDMVATARLWRAWIEDAHARGIDILTTWHAKLAHLKVLSDRKDARQAEEQDNA